jgi:NAD(P)H-dependent FMN reductase
VYKPYEGLYYVKNHTKEHDMMKNETLNIGIILSSTRDGRVSPQVGQWVLEHGKKHGQAHYEILDIRQFQLPFLGETDDQSNINVWKEALARQDGFIFIVAEYNHSITGALKNALDLARDEWNNKAAGIVSYGSVGGARAAEHLRGILGELQVADVRTHVALSMHNDFEKWSTFKPLPVHDNNLKTLFDQVITWSKALKTLR